MSTNILKAELGVKPNKSEHHHQHHHDKIIVPQTASNKSTVTQELQSQLGQGKKVDQKYKTRKLEPEANNHILFINKFK